MKVNAEMVQQIHQWWATGEWSCRRIAKALQLCHKTVRRIIDIRPELRIHDADQEECQEEETDPGPPSRCPDCGGMVYLPCRLCAIRQYKQRPTNRQKVRRRAA